MKIGHAGTLDPMATGLLIVATEEDTKKLHEFLKLPKVYEAEILLGLHTDTGDIEGRELPISNVQFPNNTQINNISKEEVERTLKEMVGKLELKVPAYSAIKQGGEALYKKARRGERVVPPVKTMEIKSAAFISVCHSRENGNPELDPRIRGDDKLILRIRFSVASGTYIRSLAEELGRRLGVPATLSGLRRTQIGDFRVEDAVVL
ncbi:MAG: tRNA pseudouridine(55) synthase [bacterium]|nr:tRNA pseudouridine(55) synthase [bacterium]